MTPLTVTKFDRTVAELQTFWIFCIMVAGKNSDWAMRTVNKLLRKCPDHRDPIDWLNDHQGTALHNTLVANKCGQYSRIEKAIRGSFGLDLRKATVRELEGVFGVGPKTARFFILHSRRDAEVACLDTHILKWLARHDLAQPVPSQTPQKRAEYERLESVWLALTTSTYGDISKADVDLLIWSQESGRLDGDPPFADDLFAWESYKDDLFLHAILKLRKQFVESSVHVERVLDDTDVLYEIKTSIVFPNSGSIVEDQDDVIHQIGNLLDELYG
jgi:thermostable 8-oxoguanine DNA glycosylase